MKITSTPSGITATFADGYVTVKAKKNAGAKITGYVNLAFGNSTAKIEVEQEAGSEAA